MSVRMSTQVRTNHRLYIPCSRWYYQTEILHYSKGTVCHQKRLIISVCTKILSDRGLDSPRLSDVVWNGEQDHHPVKDSLRAEQLLHYYYLLQQAASNQRSFGHSNRPTKGRLKNNIDNMFQKKIILPAGVGVFLIIIITE
jgi:hypothetical protein